MRILQPSLLTLALQLLSLQTDKDQPFALRSFQSGCDEGL